MVGLKGAALRQRGDSMVEREKRREGRGGEGRKKKGRGVDGKGG